MTEHEGEITIAASLAEVLPVDALVPLTLAGTATDSGDYVLHRYLLFPAGTTQTRSKSPWSMIESTRRWKT